MTADMQHLATHSQQTCEFVRNGRLKPYFAGFVDIRQRLTGVIDLPLHVQQHHSFELRFARTA